MKEKPITTQHIKEQRAKQAIAMKDVRDLMEKVENRLREYTFSAASARRDVLLRQLVNVRSGVLDMIFTADLERVIRKIRNQEAEKSRLRRQKKTLDRIRSRAKKGRH